MQKRVDFRVHGGGPNLFQTTAGLLWHHAIAIPCYSCRPQHLVFQTCLDVPVALLCDRPFGCHPLWQRDRKPGPGMSVGDVSIMGTRHTPFDSFDASFNGYPWLSLGTNRGMSENRETYPKGTIEISGKLCLQPQSSPGTTEVSLEIL